MPSNTTQRRSGSTEQPDGPSSGTGTTSATSADATTDADAPTGGSGTGTTEAATETATATTTTDSKSSAAKGGSGKAARKPDTKTGGARAAGARTGGAKAGGKANGGKAGGAKASGAGGAGGRAGKGPAGRPSGAKPGVRGRRPVKPVKPGPPWGTIGLSAIVVIVALSIIGYGVWYSWDASQPFGERRAQQIDGMTNYRSQDVNWLTRDHVDGKVTYKTSPPVGGNHNTTWQNCEGSIYRAQVPNEHAVHSLEHGAVWITYRPDLPAAQVEKLADKVKGKDYVFMSPYPGLDKPVSAQAWGFQLKVDDVNDDRLDKFITQFRRNANVEPGATCSGGVTITGTTPQAASASEGMPQGG